MTDGSSSTVAAASAATASTPAARPGSAGGWSGGQHSLLRVVVALFAIVGFVVGLSFGQGFLAPAGIVPCSIVGLLASAALMLGVLPRVSGPVAGAVWLWLTQFSVSGIAMGGLLIALGLFPSAPYGSLPARSRVDPDGGWRRPYWLHVSLWVLLLGSMTAHWWLEGHFGVVGIVVVLLRAVAIPLALRPFSLPASFAALFVAEALTLLPGGISSGIGHWLLLFACFEPRWIKGRSVDEPDTVYFDGDCGLCHRSVRFLMAEDPRGERFRYAPLFGPTFNERVPEDQRTDLPDSIVVQSASGALLMRSSAALRCLQRLGGLWRALGGLMRVFPRPLRDLVYDGVARVRKKIFPPPPDACPLAPQELQRTLLP